MIINYQPTGDSEPQIYQWDPQKLLNAEMEAIERVTGYNFSEFTARVLQGNAKCRRAALWVMLKRQHPTMKFDDVKFTWNELKFEFSHAEYDQLIEQAHDRTDLTAAELDAVVEKLRAEQAEAYDAGDDGALGETEGKARLPIAD